MTKQDLVPSGIRALKRVGVLMLIVTASFVGVPAAVSEATPVLSIPAGTAAVGEAFLLPIMMTGAVDVWSWQFDLAFDPAIVRATAVTEGPFLSSVGTSMFGPGVIDNATGVISLVTGAYVDLPPNPSGDGVLATIAFVALAPGAPAFHLSNTFLNLLPVGFDVTHGSFAITGDVPTPATVPEPATLLALASGLVLISARRLLHSRTRG